MEYQVPQFIEVEDKIVGPLTLKQFIYLAGGVGVLVLCYFELPFLLFVLLGLPVAGLAIALAFYKVNGKPFSRVLESAVGYYTGAKLFLWRREEPTAKENAAAAATAAAAERAAKESANPAAPRLTSGKLHELAWSLDVKNKTDE